MGLIAFDTLALAKELEGAGFPANQAEAQSRILANLMQRIEAARFEELATKRDLADETGILKRDLAEISAGLKRDLSAIEASLKRDLKELETRLETKIKELEIKLETKIKELEIRMEVRFKEVDAKIEAAKSETIKWIVTLSLAQLGVLTGILFAIIRALPVR